MTMFLNYPEWKPVTAIITAVEPRYGRSQTLETDDHSQREFFIIHFRYIVNDQAYSGYFESRMPLDPGRSMELLYDPASPQQNSKSKAYS